MERRDRSIKALQRLQYIDAIDDDNLRASSLSSWVTEYLSGHSSIEDFQLEIDQLERLRELLFKNISFLKTHRQNMKKELDDYKKIKQFLS